MPNRDWGEDQPESNEDEDEDAMAEAEMKCQRYRFGGCGLAGSEYCEFSCPFR